MTKEEYQEILGEVPDDANIESWVICLLIKELRELRKDD